MSQPSVEATLDIPDLTPAEQETMAALVLVANGFGRIVGHGVTRQDDLAEAVDKIHQLQHMIMANAFARLHPSAFRQLGMKGQWEK